MNSKLILTAIKSNITALSTRYKIKNRVIVALIVGSTTYFTHAFWDDISRIFSIDNHYIAILVSHDYGPALQDNSDKATNFHKGFFANEKQGMDKSKYKEIEVYNDKEITTQKVTQLAEDPNCILIISMVNSQLTWNILTSLLELNEEKRPALILAIATSEKIFNVAKSNYKPLVGMLPKNSKQADALYKHIENKYKNVIILNDKNNPEYSISLS